MWDDLRTSRDRNWFKSTFASAYMMSKYKMYIKVHPPSCGTKSHGLHGHRARDRLPYLGRRVWSPALQPATSRSWKATTGAQGGWFRATFLPCLRWILYGNYPRLLPSLEGDSDSVHDSSLEGIQLCLGYWSCDSWRHDHEYVSIMESS